MSDNATHLTVMPVPPEEQRLFKLNVDNTDHASPNLQFTWCLTPDGLRFLRESKVKYPYLMVIATRVEESDSREGLAQYERMIFPLHQGIGQLEFTRPGTFQIFAFVVHEHGSSRGQVARSLERFREWEARGDTFRYSVRLDLPDKGFGYPITQTMVISRTEMAGVTIDASLFAEPPPAWVSWWVNLLHEGPPRNQCIFRRRAMWAFFPLAQPLFVGLWLVLRTICCVACLLYLLLRGSRGISLRPVIHPFDMDISMIGNVNNRYPVYTKDGRERPLWQYLLLTPWHWIVSMSAFYALFIQWPALGRVIVGYILMLSVFIAGGFLVFYIRDRMNRTKDKSRHADRERHEEKVLSRYYDTQLQPLACTVSGPKKATIEALPKSHQTLVVRFLDAKSKVCKPFSS